MAKIILDPHYWWDKNKSAYCFNFSQDISSNIASTTIKIYNAENNSLVFTSTDYDNYSNGFHYLLPSALMQKDKEYTLIMYVNYINQSGATVQSDITSNMITFYYLSHPYFVFENIPSGEIGGSSYSFLFTYCQDENYPLSDYSVALISDSGEIINESDIVPCYNTNSSVSFEWVCRNLESGKYRLKINGRLTTTGADITFENLSSKFSISIPGIQIYENYDVIKATNNPEYKNVKIEIDHKLYSGRILSGNDPQFDNSSVILNDETLEFDNLDLSGDFTIEFCCKNIKANKKILLVRNDKKGVELTVTPFYEKVHCEDPTYNKQKCFYLVLRVIGYMQYKNSEYGNQKYIYSTRSNYMLCDANNIISGMDDADIPGEYNIVIHAIGGRYDITVSNRKIFRRIEGD